MDKSMNERALEAHIKLNPKFKSLPRFARRRLLRQSLKNLKVRVSPKGMKNIEIDTKIDFNKRMEAKLKEDKIEEEQND